MPAAGPAPEVAFPAVERATLANGLKIVLAERHAVPVVEPGAHPRRRLRRRPGRPPRHRQPGHDHAGRGNGQAHLPRDQRGAGPARAPSSGRAPGSTPAR
ncbi:MAG: hypothetical protein M0C28_00925 [Candidatus Moduliflexus flocculans]|nr:hypothetical protein [Candidatus Moduliflexus flocculans]